MYPKGFTEARLISDNENITNELGDELRRAFDVALQTEKKF